MSIYVIALTIVTYLSTDHPRYLCSVFTEANGKHETKPISIESANKLMWELKRKGWETKTTTSYNPYTPRVYTREIQWLHIEDGYRED